MITCPYCGALNVPGSSDCFQCGSALPTVEQKPVNGKKVRAGKAAGGAKATGSLLKGLGITAGAVATASAVTLGAVGVGNVLSDDAKLKRAMENTGEALVQQLEMQEGIRDFRAHTKELSEEEAFALELALTTEGLIADFRMDYSLPKERMCGEMIVESAGTENVVEFSGEKNELLFRIPAVTRDVYGFRLDDVKEKYTGSLLENIFGARLGEMLPEDLFAEDMMLVDTQRVWDQIWKAADVDTKDDWNGMKVYTVEWSQKNLEKLEKNYQSGMMKYVVAALEETGTGVTCYVDGDYVVMMEAVFGGDLYTISLEGPERNIWEQITITSAMRSDWEATGGVTADGENLQILLNSNSGAELEFSYRDADGSFVLRNEGEVTGTLRSDNGVSTLVLRTDAMNVGMQMKNLQGKPDRLAQKYTDILNMSKAEAARMLVQFAAKVEFIKELYTAILGVPF